MKEMTSDTTIRRCFRCKKIKSLDDFHNNRSRRLGKEYLCKECRFEVGRTQTHRENWNKNHRESVNKAVVKYGEKYPEKIEAHKLVNKAIKKGELIRGNCMVCGKDKTHAHHPDYTKPLSVYWLCYRHHKDAHFGRIQLS